jgi:hypothetical protein
LLSSPDGSKYPFGLGFSPKDIADSGSEVDEKPNTSAPKTKKTPAFRPVLLIGFAKVLNFCKGFSKLY